MKKKRIFNWKWNFPYKYVIVLDRIQGSIEVILFAPVAAQELE